ncbi:MAG: heavy metal transporter [Clostridiales bacterium]|nr:heavy metal transporter [Clostridiales bacterium]
MNSNEGRVALRVTGMHCQQCEAAIERGLGKIGGVQSVRARFRGGRVEVEYNAGRVDEAALAAALAKLGYPVAAAAEERPGAALGLLTAAALLIVYAAGDRLGWFARLGAIPLARQGMGMAALFAVGLMTSMHCVAMCGGIGLTQCIGGGRAAGARSSALYNAGRVVSYTAVGALVGALGSVVQFSRQAQSAVMAVAGVFMVLMGLNLMGALPWTRRLLPGLPRPIAAKLGALRGRGQGAFAVGLLNGLMPCGPLQAMQLYALSTGSALRGALSMLAFSLGTVPLMLALGLMGSLLSRRAAGRLTAIGAALVAVMGVAMIGNGLAKGGLALPPAGSAIVAQAPADEPDAAPTEQLLRSELSGWEYPPISVVAGVPVKWTLHADRSALNGCNAALEIPEYDLAVRLQPGDNLIEFTPTRTGTFVYSCWMGMIRSTITVTGG